MMPWRRPAPHPSWEADSATALTALRMLLQEPAREPCYADFEKNEIWGKGIHKLALLAPSRSDGKCVYCEAFRERSELHVEHYRPKVRVKRIEIDRERLPTNEPPAQIDVGPGYWWLAFDWSNYALACGPCNGTWKRNVFPVEGDDYHVVEGGLGAERPLLLGPGTDFNPAEHFRWTVGGQIEPLTAAGRATIATCGLNRTPLATQRARKWAQLDGLLYRLRNLGRRGQQGSDEFVRTLRQIAAAGERTAEFTAMVRWQTEQSLGRAWADFADFPD